MRLLIVSALYAVIIPALYAGHAQSADLSDTGPPDVQGSSDGRKSDGIFYPDCPSKDPEQPVILPHPRNCAKFYVCSGGRAHEKECTNGLHFNQKLRVCDYPENAKCSLRHSASASRWCPKTNTASAKLLPHESDCRRFYICESGKAMEHKCPPNLHFNPNDMVCDYPNRAGCKEKLNTNRPVGKILFFTTSQPAREATGKPSPYCPTIDGKHPVFFPHPTNCSIYYMCSNGLAYEFVCPDGLHFNRRLNVCDRPYNAGCLRAKLVGSSTDPTTPLCPRGKSAVATLLPHEGDCTRYYVCESSKLTEKQCPNGLHFSPFLKVCDYPDQAKCTSGKKDTDH